MTKIKVYVSCERGDDIEMRSPVFEITKKNMTIIGQMTAVTTSNTGQLNG